MVPKKIKVFLKKRKYILVLGFLILLHYMGVFTHLFEQDFYTEFSYPLEEDISVFVRELRDGRNPSHDPINQYNFPFIYNCKYKCRNENGPLGVVYIVKSAIPHFKKRLAIRNSWGFEKRFSDVPIRTVFVLGVDSNNPEVQKNIDLESRQFGDIVQANFTDDYYNCTIKTMMGFKWAVNYCKNSKFYFFVDDDCYVSTKNVLQFLRNPLHYPAYLETPINSLDAPKKVTKRDISNTVGDNSPLKEERTLLQVLDVELPEKVKLWSGFVFASPPHRHRTSTWYVPLAEYPFHLWPPYVSGNAYVVSKEVLLDLYYGSFFTNHFRFDDIFLGLIAYKLNIQPFYCKEFYFYKKDFNVHGYRYVIASHGYKNPEELLEVWDEQRSVGNA